MESELAPSKPHKGFIDWKAWFKYWEDSFLTTAHVVNKIKNDLNFMNRCKLKHLANFVLDYSTSVLHLKHLVLDFCKFKLGLSHNKDLRIDNHNYFKSFIIFPFPNKAVELFNLKTALRAPDLKEAFPLKSTYPSISYRLSRPLKVIACNYRKFVKDLDLNKIEELPCY